MNPDRVAVLVVSGRIIAALHLPTGFLLWDLFAHRCRLVPAANGERLDIEELKDSDGVKFFELEEFVWRVAADVSPQA
jgi:hypothetical protein